MSIRIKIIGLILILYTTTFAQNKQVKIQHISSIFNAINTNSSLKKIFFDDNLLSKSDPKYQSTDNGQELTGYFKNGTLVKIVYSIGLSFGVKTFEFYFENDQTIFIYEKEQNFGWDNKNAALDDTHLTIGFEGRYYLDQNKIFEKIEKGNLIGERNEAFNLSNSDVPKYRKILIKAFGSK